MTPIHVWIRDVRVRDNQFIYVAYLKAHSSCAKVCFCVYVVSVAMRIDKHAWLFKLLTEEDMVLHSTSY